VSQTIAQKAAFRLWAAMRDRATTHIRQEPEKPESKQKPKERGARGRFAPTPELPEQIQRLKAQGLRRWQIALKLGVSRMTVGRYWE